MGLKFNVQKFRGKIEILSILCQKCAAVYRDSVKNRSATRCSNWPHFHYYVEVFDSWYIWFQCPIYRNCSRLGWILSSSELPEIVEAAISTVKMHPVNSANHARLTRNTECILTWNINFDIMQKYSLRHIYDYKTTANKVIYNTQCSEYTIQLQHQNTNTLIDYCFQQHTSFLTTKTGLFASIRYQ